MLAPATLSLKPFVYKWNLKRKKILRKVIYFVSCIEILSSMQYLFHVKSNCWIHYSLRAIHCLGMKVPKKSTRWHCCEPNKKKFTLTEIEIISERMFRSILNFTSQMQMPIIANKHKMCTHMQNTEIQTKCRQKSYMALTSQIHKMLSNTHKLSHIQ